MQPGQSAIPKPPKGIVYAAAIASAAIVASVGYAVGHRPLAQWRADVSKRADFVREKLVEGPALRREQATHKKELEDLLTRVEEVNRRVPDTPREGEFLADLSGLGASLGVTIDGFRRGRVVQTPTHSVVTVVATASGRYRGLCELVEGIATLPRLVEITELRIAPNPNDEQHQLNVTYALYYAMAPPNAVNSDAQ